MENEKKSCNLELAIKLKDLGFKQDAQFGWYDAQIAKVIKSKKEVSRREFESGQVEYVLIADAPTVAELGERLPKDFCSMKTAFKDKKRRWMCGSPLFYADDHYGVINFVKYQYAKTEADARAKVIIADLEDKK